MAEDPNLDELLENILLVAEVEERGYDTAWAGESGGLDAVTVLTVIASGSRRLRVASGVIPVQTRSPIVLGQTAAALGHIAPGRVVLGLDARDGRVATDGWLHTSDQSAFAVARRCAASVSEVIEW